MVIEHAARQRTDLYRQFLSVCARVPVAPPLTTAAPPYDPTPGGSLPARQPHAPTYKVHQRQSASCGARPSRRPPACLPARPPEVRRGAAQGGWRRRGGRARRGGALRGANWARAPPDQCSSRCAGRRALCAEECESDCGEREECLCASLHACGAAFTTTSSLFYPLRSPPGGGPAPAPPPRPALPVAPPRWSAAATRLDLLCCVGAL